MIKIPWARDYRKPSGDSSLPLPGDIQTVDFRIGFDAITAAILIVDPSSRIAFANLAAERMFLYEANQLRDQPIEVLLPAAHRAGHAAQVAAFFTAPAARSMGAGRHFVASRHDGTEFPAEIGLSPLETTDGTYVVATIVDRTESHRLATVAREQLELFQGYFETASEGLISVESSGVIERVNKAAERIFGYTRAELVGQPMSILIPEGSRPSHAKQMEGYFAEPRLRPVQKGALFGRKKDGTRFPVDVGINHSRIGTRDFAIAFVTDLSEKRRMEEEAKVLAALLDLQQQVVISRRSGATSGDVDKLTGLATRTMFERATLKAHPDLQEFYIVFFFVQRMQPMRERYGSSIADRILVFASQYILSRIENHEDQLFRWEDGIVALVKRESSEVVVRREAARTCGAKLDCRMNEMGLDSFFAVELCAKVLPLGQVPLPEVVARIDRLVRA